MLSAKPFPLCVAGRRQLWEDGSLAASSSSPFFFPLLLLPPSFPILPLLPLFLLLLLHSYKWKVIVRESEFSQHKWDSYTYCDCCWTIGTLGEEISQRETPLLPLWTKVILSPRGSTQKSRRFNFAWLLPFCAQQHSNSQMNSGSSALYLFQWEPRLLKAEAAPFSSLWGHNVVSHFCRVGVE